MLLTSDEAGHQGLIFKLCFTRNSVNAYIEERGYLRM